MEILIAFISMPVMLIGLGYLFLSHPPKKKNSAIGFRTRKSSKSQRNWDIAQKYFGKSMLITGLLSAVFFGVIYTINLRVGLSNSLLEKFALFPIFLLIPSIIYINMKLPD